MFLFLTNLAAWAFLAAIIAGLAYAGGLLEPVEILELELAELDGRCF